MGRQNRHIMLLCLFTRKTVSFTNALCKGRKAHQSGTGKPSKNPDQTGYCKSLPRVCGQKSCSLNLAKKNE